MGKDPSGAGGSLCTILEKGREDVKMRRRTKVAIVAVLLAPFND